MSEGGAAVDGATVMCTAACAQSHTYVRPCVMVPAGVDEAALHEVLATFAAESAARRARGISRASIVAAESVTCNILMNAPADLAVQELAREIVDEIAGALVPEVARRADAVSIVSRQLVSTDSVTATAADRFPVAVIVPGGKVGEHRLCEDQWGVALGDHRKLCLVIAGPRDAIHDVLRSAVDGLEDTYAAEHENGRHDGAAESRCPDCAPEPPEMHHGRRSRLVANRASACPPCSGDLLTTAVDRAALADAVWAAPLGDDTVTVDMEALQRAVNELRRGRG